MLTHKGTQTLETPRLLLRRAVTEDAQAMFENWANDPDVTHFLTWPPHESVEVTRAVLQSWAEGYRQDDYYQWMIVPKDLGQPIGSLCATVRKESTDALELGYCLGRTWWHQGIMLEAVNAVIDFLFDQVNAQRVEAKHDIRNPRSGGVMKQCGMKYEGTTRGGDRNNQGICDCACYAILRTDRGKPAHFMDDFHGRDDTELVQELYRRADEDSRLTRSQSAQVEFLTTVKYIEDTLPAGAKILDVGAGTGAYSLYLARKGYQVSALELSERNCAVFREKLTADDKIELTQGNALDLSRYPDASFDAVLLFGPLYHLHSEADRLQCIREARRVCRRGGKIFFAFISHDMVILTMQQAHDDYLLHGDYDKATFRLDDRPFVFHTVDDCRALLARGGVELEREVAADGASELLGGMIDRMDADSFRQYLRYHFYLCEKKEFLGMSNHLLFIGR